MKFEDLFIGSELSHGVWDLTRIDRETLEPSPALTVPGPATPGDYASHLEGKVGLGLVPVRKDGTCVFGAIDIDIDDIDHALLATQVKNLGLPLHVCRSKSGGAHLYAFTERGEKAGTYIAQLGQWAKQLGYGKAEIFPKQATIGANNFGNWINLPYFGSARGDTVRSGWEASGPISLSEFLSEVQYWDGTVRANTRKLENTGGAFEVLESGVRPGGLDSSSYFNILNQGPPCVESIVAQGIPDGMRNLFMFNTGIVLKRIEPNTWEATLAKINQERVNPPLTKTELKMITRSVANKKYALKCDDDALEPYCKRTECGRRTYGVKYRGDAPVITRGQAVFSNLRKTNTIPPSYTLQVDDKDIRLDTEEFIVYSKLKKKVIELLNIVLPSTKQSDWEGTIVTLLDTVVEHTPPEEASQQGLIWGRCVEFLMRYTRARSREDLIKGLPFVEDDFVLFKFSALMRYLSQFRLAELRTEMLYERVRGLGGHAVNLRIGSTVVKVWSVPVAALPAPAEDFTPIQLPNSEEL